MSRRSSANANRGCDDISPGRRANGRTWRRGAVSRTERPFATVATSIDCGSRRPGPASRRSTVERVGGLEEDELTVRLAPSDRRTTAALLEAWFKPRARAAIDRDIARHATALGVTPIVDRHPRSADPLGECVAKGPAVVLVAAHPGTARGPRDRRDPRAGAPARLRARSVVLGPGRLAPAGSCDLAHVAARPLARVARSPRRSSRGAAGRLIQVCWWR